MQDAPLHNCLQPCHYLNRAKIKHEGQAMTGQILPNLLLKQIDLPSRQRYCSATQGVCGDLVAHCDCVEVQAQAQTGLE